MKKSGVKIAGKKGTRAPSLYSSHKFLNSKRAQVTIFIIAAVAIVAIVLIFVFFRQKIIPQSPALASQNPEAFLQSCTNKQLTEVADTLILHGGTYDLSKNSTVKMRLDNDTFSYLCYTDQYYKPCISQQPSLLEHMKQELKANIQKKVKDCFDQMEKALSEEQYAVNLNGKDFTITLAPKRILVYYDYTLTITKAGATQTFDSFKSVVKHQLYDLTIVAQEIASQEGKYCNFEQVGYSLLYPQFSITRFVTGNGDRVYTIIYKASGETFRFATRGCVIPPGF